MKKLLSLKSLPVMAISLFLFTFAGQSPGQNVTTPRAVSPAAELKQRIGLTDITVNYSRPRVTLNGNDRTGKIWGQLIPYGFNKINFAGQGEIPWRAGANENTTIEFTDDVKIEGKDLSAGKYGLHMAIYEDDRATIIFSNNHTSWGSYFYDPKEDALRVDVRMKTIPYTEVLTYSFTDMGNDYAVLALSWEKKQIPFKIEVDVHKVVLANFRNELKSLPGFGWQGFQTAANYCWNNNINHEEALKWAEIAVTRNRSFPTLSTKAGLLFQTGKQAESDKALDEAASLGTKNQLNQLGYQLLNLKRYKKAIGIFKLNIEKDPKDANGYGSLGEAYKIAGNKENAVKNLKKALSLNPATNVKANSERLLKELGETGIQRELDVSGKNVTILDVGSYFSMYMYGPTLKFYHLKDQNAVIKIYTEGGNESKDLYVSVTVNIFDKGDSWESIEAWINNQHSDAILMNTAKPIGVYPLNKKSFSVASQKFINHTKSPAGDEYDNYAVKISVDNVSNNGVFDLKAFVADATVHIRTKDIKRD